MAMLLLVLIGSALAKSGTDYCAAPRLPLHIADCAWLERSGLASMSAEEHQSEVERLEQAFKTVESIRIRELLVREAQHTYALALLTGEGDHGKFENAATLANKTWNLDSQAAPVNQELYLLWARAVLHLGGNPFRQDFVETALAVPEDASLTPIQSDTLLLKLGLAVSHGSCEDLEKSPLARRGELQAAREFVNAFDELCR